MRRHLLRHFRLLLIGLFAITFGLVIILQSCTNPSPTSDATPDPFTERMAKEHKGDKPIASEVAEQKPSVKVASTMVEYATVNGQSVQGFFSQPAESDKPLPGIIAIHEWWGLNDNIKAVTERLAGEGYSVLAVDLYGGQIATKPDQAKQLMQSVMQNTEPAKANLLQAFDYLTIEKQTPRVGSIGWCFGGAWSLNTGLLLPKKLDALVIYYGRLETNPDVLASLQMPIAGFFGRQDKGIPVADVKAFEATLKELDKSAEIHIYDDANHAFANPSGKNYSKKAATDAWEKTTAFLAKTLKS